MLSPADIADRLISNRTKPGIARLAESIMREGLDIEAYIDEVQKRPLPVRWHMTWLLSHYVERKGSISPQDQLRLWTLLSECGNRSMARDLWRALSFIELDDEIAGDVFDAAVAIIPAPAQPVALRAHAMYAARNIARPWAELRRELILVIEDLPPDESAAIRTRSKAILREFRTQGVAQSAD